MSDISCIICSQKTSYAGKLKHLFSCAHKQDFYNGVLRSKEKFKEWLTSTKKPVMPSVILKSKAYKVCFPCKSVVPSIGVYVRCPKGCDGVENAKVIKDILETKVFKENPAYQTSRDTQATQEKATDTGPSGEVAKLRKQIDLDKRIVEKAMNVDDALTAVLERLKEKDMEAYKEAMEALKEFPSVYEAQDG
jgi:hypothetical protein